jgi:DHA1 family multidrug resistance protein-like MFS transporter
MSIAWTVREDVHWIVSCIFLGVSNGGVFIIMQGIFMYLPFTYPQYSASLFAANDFVRSAIAAAAILFARPLYINLGVPRGVTLLAGISTGCIFGVYFLYYRGAWLRSKSRFAVKE